MKESAAVSDNLKRNLDAVNVFIENISKSHSITFQQVLDLLNKDENEIKIPSFILRDGKLGILEAATKFLKEENNLTYHKIAKLLNRDDRVVWVTYNNAVKKKKEKFHVGEPNHWIPISIFSNTSLGPLEAISKYLVEKSKLNFISIAKLLNRDNKSIWACYNRSKHKRKDEN